ncbi:hypothetical protein K458DRAFT_413390 [Lentithecium fluviatile CBS 122367]|uniref:Uncharacterized protein n=1 Tax=Lentithecium fluviatile CBS 122367 TaxID=1168545 RepID=A0A6G1JFS9_9PLEO|nr:hypothetical protein K458DRAFT_413390 [Lentithecium fluviatile CBS 122367]
MASDMSSRPDKRVAASPDAASDRSTDENDFTPQLEENPLEVATSSSSIQASSSSIQATPSIMQRQDPLDLVHDHHHAREEMDEPPPPYQELENIPADVDRPRVDSSGEGVQIAPIEYSIDNSPQLSVGPQLEFMEVAARSSNLVAQQAPELSAVQAPGSPALNDPSLVPAPLQIRPASSNSGVPRVSAPSHASQSRSMQNFSSAKAKEAGFELDPPPSPGRSVSTSSSGPSVTVLNPHEPLTHTRDAGKVTAYLVPFPKPRIKGVKPEDIPERFLVYTPILPPLSKPADGEKESHWHKTQRQWQEDVRKATMSKASAATWKGMKARTTSLIHKGVNMTRSSNVEFLDRVSGGAITSTTEEMEGEEPSHRISEAELSAEPTSIHPTSPSEATPPSPRVSRTATSVSTSTSNSSCKDKEKDHKPKALQDLTLVYPPPLPPHPSQIRQEFIDTLLRTREKSRKDAVVASTLLPFAAALDASLIFTLGGLTQVSGVWAYTSTRGAMTSRKMTKGLARGEEYAAERGDHVEAEEECELQVHGCTCGHHESTFGPLAITPKHSATSSHSKHPKHKHKPGINLHLQQSSQLEILKRYLDLACLKKEFHMFPQIDEAVGDVGEGTVLEAIGWKPVRRQGRDLEVEFKDRVERLTGEEDERYQVAEAREDVKRYFRKGAAEWVAWCRAFGKDPEGMGKK